MSRFTHFINDPESPARAVVFKAYKCSHCGRLHLSKENRTSVMPWITAAVTENLTKISDIPPTNPH